MNGEQFFDGVTGLHVNGNIVRIDLGCINIPQQDPQSQEKRLEKSDRMVMSLDGFLQMYNEFGNLVKQLSDKGVIRNNNANLPPLNLMGDAPQNNNNNSGSVPNVVPSAQAAPTSPPAGTSDEPAFHIKL